MEEDIEAYIAYLRDSRQASRNTVMSYTYDLNRFCAYMKENGKTDVREIISTNLTSYVLYLERIGLSPATISRSVASIRAFFLYLLRRGRIKEDPCEQLRSPRIEKRSRDSLSMKEMDRLLTAPSPDTPKGMRDRAILALIYETGIQIAQLNELGLNDVNLNLDYICCHEEEQDRVIPFGRITHEALDRYIQEARMKLCPDSEKLFSNCRGNPMSRQGVWKLIKQYALAAGIEQEITLPMIRYSYEQHQTEKRIRG